MKLHIRAAKKPQLPEYLYHVTYWNRLQGIANRGLVFNCSASMGGGYQFHCDNAVFLGDFQAMEYYYNRSEDFAYHNSDHVGRDGYVPVVLKVDSRYFEPHDWEMDQLSSGAGEAYKVHVEVPYQRIQVWDGYSWIPIKQWRDVDPNLAIDLEYEDEDEQEGEYSSFKTSQPLKPKKPGGSNVESCYSFGESSG